MNAPNGKSPNGENGREAFFDGTKNGFWDWLKKKDIFWGVFLKIEKSKKKE
jgi:hypothetical protein